MNIEDGDTITIKNPDISPLGGLVFAEDKRNKRIIFQNKDKSKHFKVKSFHMSCDSDKIDFKENYLGMVLYSYKGKTDWELNEIHCKSGYMYIKIDHTFVNKECLKSRHAQLYKSLFGVFPKDEVVGAGFAIQNGIIKFKSVTFNADDTHKNEEKDCEFHDNSEFCHPIEQKWIKIALKNWKNGIQNTMIEEQSDICWDCITKVHQIKDL